MSLRSGSRLDATRLGDRLTNLDGPLRRLGIVVTRAKHTNRGTPYVFTKSDSPKSDAGDAGSDAGKGQHHLIDLGKHPKVML